MLRSLLFLLLTAAFMTGAERNLGALVLVNSQAPDYEDFARVVEPYLAHFGVPYEPRDISAKPLGDSARGYSLVIVGHHELDAPRRFFTAGEERRLLEAVRDGTGLVSFDGLLTAWSGKQPRPLYSYPREIFGLEPASPSTASEIRITAEHFITAQSPIPRTVALKRTIAMAGVSVGAAATVLARAGEQPLLVAATHGKGRAALFSSYEWTRPDVKGRLYGLDDLVWRSLVWAANKPFLLRGMPRYLAVRIDDVSGFGIGLNRHLGYLAALNRRGLKPWLGLFIGDLEEDPHALAELTRLTREGLATASVHARRWRSFFYLDEPLLTDEHGRNIAGRPWPADKMAANFAEGEQFLARHGIPKSKLVIPHFYQFALNNFDGIAAGGAEFVATVLRPGYGYGTPMLAAWPYLATEPPRPSNARDPVYIADWLDVPGRPDLRRRFFNFVVEIRDVAGYEWAPSSVPVEEAIRRGVEQCRRSFDSLVPAVLFTHESDHIQHIPPEDWERIVNGVMDRLAPYQPVPVTLEYLAQYLRALRTSRLVKARYIPEQKALELRLEGAADLATKFYIYDETPEGPAPEELEAPPFTGTKTLRLRIR